ncbi:MAG: redox-sensing transcriptional repressor Rex [bacterium]
MVNRIEKTAKIPTIKRLPGYLHILRQLHQDGAVDISGAVIADMLKLDPVQVRKDLASTGVVGRPRIGFPIEQLITAIENFLGWNNEREAFLVGAGNLGAALMGYSGLGRAGVQIIAAFDNDLRKIGTTIHGKPILPIEKLSELARRMHVKIAILTLPEEEAQKSVDRMIRGGITAIWNFTPATLKVPEGVIVQNEDLSSGLAVLSRKLHVNKQKTETRQKRGTKNE